MDILGAELNQILRDTPDSISEGKIYDARDLDGDEITKANIIPKLDEIDTE